MRFGFVTCVQLGLSCMEEIYAAGGTLDLVITLREELGASKAGRVYLDEFCRQRGIRLLKCRHVNDPDVINAVKETEIDWLFVIGWSQVAGTELLRAPGRGVLGMHPTLLPEGRGRAAIPWAILKDLDRTGVTLFKLDEGIDTGPIIEKEVIELRSEETATTLYARVNEAHKTLIRRSWPSLAADAIRMEPQDDSLASEWPGRRPEDGRIAPAKMTACEIDRLVRAVTHPYPGAFFDSTHERVRVWAGTAHSISTPESQILKIDAIDGSYFATNFEFEPLPF